MIFGSHLVADGDPAATLYGLPRPKTVGFADASPFGISLTRGEARPKTTSAAPAGGVSPASAAWAPAPAAWGDAAAGARPASALPVVAMPRVTSTAHIEFSLEASGIGTKSDRERLREEALEMKRLQRKLGISDAAAAEMDLRKAVFRGLERSQSAADLAQNPIAKRLQETIDNLPPLSRKQRPTTSRPRPLARSMRPAKRSASRDAGVFFSFFLPSGAVSIDPPP